MSDLKIYGHIISRASRVMWMAEELGLEYDLETIDVHKGDQNTPDYLALNPNARVPTIKDGDTVLWESLGINLYLAKKHGGPLAPKTAEDEARAVQWSMWALTEAEDNCVIIIQKAMEIQDHDAALVSAAEEALALRHDELTGDLGALPPMKIHCAQLVEGALKSALSPNEDTPPADAKSAPTLVDSLQQADRKPAGGRLRLLKKKD